MPTRLGSVVEMTSPAPNSELRGRLLGIKLRALVAEHLGRPVEGEPKGFPSGAGIVVDGQVWVLVDGVGERALGPALAWALRQGATSLGLIADHDGGTLARRAAGFDLPIEVWFPEERTLLPVGPTDLADPPGASAEHLDMIPMIEAGGADPVVEHGVVAGEVRGLEVCRVVAQPTIGRLTEPGDADLAALIDQRLSELANQGVILEVGVGANDREAFQLLHGDVPKVDALSRVVDAVRAHRDLAAPQHPLNRMAIERFLRWQAIEDPALVGMVQVEATEPPTPRPSMKESAPCVAIGRDADGGRHVLVFGAGVDLDLLAFAVDAAALVHRSLGDADGVVSTRVVLRSADAVPILHDLAALFRGPLDIVTI